MKRTGLLDEGRVPDSPVFNTRWTLRRPASFLIHYHGTWTEIRALTIANDDALLN